jgi:hypothetical protein
MHYANRAAVKSKKNGDENNCELILVQLKREMARLEEASQLQSCRIIIIKTSMN